MSLAVRSAPYHDVEHLIGLGGQANAAVPQPSCMLTRTIVTEVLTFHSQIKWTLPCHGDQSQELT